MVDDGVRRAERVERGGLHRARRLRLSVRSPQLHAAFTARSFTAQLSASQLPIDARGLADDALVVLAVSYITVVADLAVAVVAVASLVYSARPPAPATQEMLLNEPVVRGSE